MRGLLVAVLLLAATARSDDFVVVDSSGAGPRAAILIIDGQAYRITTTPIVGPGPSPTPKPDPTPPPAPTPAPKPIVTGHMFATYVVDASAATPSDVALRTSTTIRQALPTLDTSWRTYRSDESELARANLVAYATAAGYPCLIIQSSDGKVQSSSKVASETDVIATVKRLRGQP